VEDIDYRVVRGLDKAVVRSLIQDSDWVRRHQHIFLVGATGLGKTYLARAFGTEGVPRRIHRILRDRGTVVPGTGTGAGRWKLREESCGRWSGGMC